MFVLTNSCSATFFEVDELCPGIGLESKQLIRAPIDSINFVCVAIRHRGYGEWETVDWHLLVSLLAHT